MIPVSPSREPKSSDPIPMPQILLFRNDSSLPSLEPPCYEPSFERFRFDLGFPNTILFVNELSDQEQDEDEDDDHSMSSSRYSSQSGWRSAVKRFNLNFAKCFRPPVTHESLRAHLGVSSSPRHSIVNGGEYRSISRQEDIVEEEEEGGDMSLQEEEDEEGGEILMQQEAEMEEAVEYDDVSHPTASPTSSPSNNVEGY